MVLISTANKFCCKFDKIILHNSVFSGKLLLYSEITSQLYFTKTVKYGAIMDKTYWNEKWKPLHVEGVEKVDKYQISNYGRIKCYSPRLNDWRFLKGTIIKGYRALMIKLDNGKSVTKYIHKLVAESFLPKESEEQNFVVHKNFDKTNNFVENLRWATANEVGGHHKLNPKRQKKIITNSKLNETKVKVIKRILARNKEGKTRLKMIAKQFGITHTQLNRIRSGENWGYVMPD